MRLLTRFAVALAALLPISSAFLMQSPIRAGVVADRAPHQKVLREEPSSRIPINVAADFDPSTYNVPQPTDEGQKNMARGWTYMSIYWICGLAIAQYMNYFSPSHLTFPTSGPFNFWYAVAGLSTYVAHKVMSSRNLTYGREINVPATGIFALLNGVWETMWFYGSYDIGKWLGGLWGLSHNASVALAFTTFFCYSGAIHVLFWLKAGLPPHSDPKAPNFMVHGFPALSGMSIAWMIVYELTGSIVLPIALHILFNYFTSLTMHFPGPGHRHVPDS